MQGEKQRHDDAAASKADRIDARQRDEEALEPASADVVSTVLGLQQSAGNVAVRQLLQERGVLSSPGDVQEREADLAAHTVAGGGTTSPQALAARASAGSPGPLREELGAGLESIGPGEPLPANVRTSMEPRFGTEFGDVRVHTGTKAEQANSAFGADAFTYGRDIYYGPGRAPAADALTAHELSHVVQQRPSTGSLAAKRIQPSFSGSYPVALGAFEIDMQTKEGGVNTPPTHSGFDGYIRFVPNPDAPNSNTIVMIQIVKLTDLGKADVDPASLPPGQAPRGALGDPGLRTADDPASGVEGGFFTDVHHRGNVGLPAAPQGSGLSPRFNFQPAPGGTVGVAGTTQQPAQYGGGTGGVVGQTPGFKRSNEPADIKSAALFDTPGIADGSTNLDFEFESVARGEDTMVTYGTVKWGFGIRAGKVINEHLNTDDAASATFAMALERHRDFYVHEPVTFYFPFDSDSLESPESAKIDTFLDYLTRNPTVRLSLQGVADIRGGASKHNRDLSRNRAEAVAAELIAKGVDPSRLDPVTIAPNVPASATTDAGTGDQGGDAAAAANQDREENRQFNRRVVLTFIQTASTPVGGAGP